MDVLVIAAQIVIALGIYNVWLYRRGRPTAWRGGSAADLRQEFETYGLPGWAMFVVGALKLTLATLLVAGIWLPQLATPAAFGLAVLMIGAILMHARVGDPVRRSIPALTVLALCVFVAAM